MELNDRLDKFEKLVSNEQSGWLDKFSYYKNNKSWLDKSSKVAINVLEALKEKGLSQKDLAQKMNVSAQQVNKILRGQQNLTLETISKLETTLEISLIKIIDFKKTDETTAVVNNKQQIKTTLKPEKAKALAKQQIPDYEKNIALAKNQKKPTAPQFKNI